MAEEQPQPSVTHRDTERIRTETKRVTQHTLAWHKHDKESMSQYLCRLGTRGSMKQGLDKEPTTLDAVLEKIAIPLGMSASKFSLAVSSAKARSLNKNYGYCCCTDVKRLTTNFKADTSANMTLAELQKSADAGKGCVRCWLITECVMTFAHHWSGISHSDVIVTGGEQLVDGNGSVAIFTVFWVEPAVREQYPQHPKWSKLAMEVYRDEDGYMLYPNMKPRKKFLIDINADECAKIVQPWIETCSTKHIFCADESTSFIPTRLLDVGPNRDMSSVRLVHGTETRDPALKFVALSYCWGSPKDRVKPIPMTVHANIAERFKNMEWDELTPTFQDAIALTRALGFRYIWIDALCIIQDDEQDFAREASQMASIYGQAHLVIAATRALTGDAGLLQPRPKPRKLTHRDSTGTSSSVLVRKEIDHDDFTTGEPRQFTSAPLFARAWCFQERLLARRIVHFGSQELLFECREGLDCECGMLPTDNGLYHNFKVSCAYGLEKTTAKSRYQTWYSVLRPYTARSLTYGRDRLPALSGFAKLVSLPAMGAYCAGMWEGELPGGLLWRVIRPVPQHGDVIARPDPYRAPTWSWAGINAVVEGHIQFHDGMRTVAKVQHVECVPSTSDPFGEVSSGYIVLEAPAVQTILHAESQDNNINGRGYLLSRTHEPDEQISFVADLQLQPTVTVTVTVTLCVAIEHDVKGFDQGRWSCLVLQKDEREDHYYRVGVAKCPPHWLSEEAVRAVVKIL